jgi:hypothetical protein
MKIKCEIEISRSRLADVLCAGMESGIGYWAEIHDYVTPPKGADVFAGMEDWHSKEDGVFKHIHFPMCEAGGGVVLADCTGDDGFPGEAKTVTLDYPALLRGLQLMAIRYPRHFASIADESEDADTGDCLIQLGDCLIQLGDGLIQLAVFGELVFRQDLVNAPG